MLKLISSSIFTLVFGVLTFSDFSFYIYTIWVGLAFYSGNFNIALGASALNDNTTGYENIGIGFVALQKNDSGYQNIGVGRGSIGNNTIGNNNLGMGYFSLQSNVSGNQNIAIGGLALEKSTIHSAMPPVMQPFRIWQTYAVKQYAMQTFSAAWAEKNFR